MTLICEVAAGIVLGVALIAIVVAFREALVVAVMGLVSLVAVGAGIAIFYYICGSLEKVALVALVFGGMGGAAWLIRLFNNHEKYGPSFRAMGNAIVVCSAVTTIIVVSILPVIVAHRIGWYYVVFPTIFVFILSVRFCFGRSHERELGAAHEKSV